MIAWAAVVLPRYWLAPVAANALPCLEDDAPRFAGVLPGWRVFHASFRWRLPVDDIAACTAWLEAAAGIAVVAGESSAQASIRHRAGTARRGRPCAAAERLDVRRFFNILSPSTG
jgi:hypothetical protein